MLKDDNKDYLYLIWQEPVSRKRYIVGELTKNGDFEFTYCHEINDALSVGFELLVSFPDKNQSYKSVKLFQVFAARLPDAKRTDIDLILKKYSLSQYDEYNLLKASGAKLPIDNIEFIDPLPLNITQPTTRKFYIAGVKYYIGCKDEKKCEESLNIKIGDSMFLEHEATNIKDQYATKINTNKNDLVGYIPRYYAKRVSKHINDNLRYSCKIIEANKNGECSECIKVELTLIPANQ